MQNSFYEKIRIAFKERDKDQIIISTKELLIDEYAISFLRENAIYHPLGFIYLVLHRFENDETIRMHIWNKERWYQEPLMDIHDHYYTVNSFVFKGLINNRIYKEFQSKPTHCFYQGSYAPNGERILQKTEREICVQQIYSETILQGSLYQITKDELHSSYVDESIVTVTLVYTESPSLPTPTVLGPLNGEKVYYYPIRKVGREIMDDILKEISF